jgi:dienelactone hydrolase
MLNAVTEESRIIPASGVALLADVGVPAQVIGLIVFVHGSGSGRRSPRNRRVATALQQAGFATVLIDLLSGEEAVRDELDYSLRFDIDLLSRRVEAVVDWLAATPSLADVPLGLYGASTGAAAALVATAHRPAAVAAVVSRGGRLDLAGAALPPVQAPTMLIVGGNDQLVMDLNREAMRRLTGVSSARRTRREPPVRRARGARYGHRPRRGVVSVVSDPEPDNTFVSTRSGRFKGGEERWTATRVRLTRRMQRRGAWSSALRKKARKPWRSPP